MPWCAATIIGSMSRAGMRCGRRALARRSLAIHGLAYPGPRGSRQRPRHAETGGVHEAPDGEQQRAGQPVYEPFAGSGTTLIAAEMTGCARHVIELNPGYVDVAVCRWQAFRERPPPRKRTATALPKSWCSAASPARWTFNGAAGGKPEPIAAKIAAGRPGKRTLAMPVRAPGAGDVICPRAVQRNARALVYWTMYLANAAPNHLSLIDAPLLARLRMALAYADEANDKIEELGLLVKAPNTGLPIQSP